MGVTKKSFLLYLDNFVWLRGLEDEQKARLLEALFGYASDVCTSGERPVDYLERVETGLNNNGRTVFGFMADSIYRDTEKWRRVQEGRALRRLQKEQEEHSGS